MIESIRTGVKKLTIPLRKKYLEKKYSYSCDGYKICGPAFVFCSYLSKIDPLAITTSFCSNLHLVVDSNLSLKYFNKLKSIFGFICADPTEPDIAAIRKIEKLIKNNGIIVFFPFEQPYTEFGIKKVYSKLIKKYRAPSFVVNVFGSKFAKPIWSKGRNYTPIEVKISDYLDKDYILSSGIEKIEKRLYDSLMLAQSETNAIRYVGKNPAENIEKKLFACPECGALCTIKSKKDRFWCSACGDSNSFLPNGMLIGAHFKDINSWGIWQSEYVNEIIKRRTENDEVILHDIGFKVKNNNKSNKMFKGFFETFLFPDRLLIANKKFRKEIKLDNILDIKVNNKNCLIIYAKPNDKIFLCPTTCISTIKYCNFIEKLKSLAN